MLKTSLMRVQGADEDYQGHRVRAMEHISAALRHLGAASNFNPHVGASAGTMTQAQSDEALSQAIRHLHHVENSLGNGTNTYEHHRFARTSVAEAIRELHTALNIR